MQETAKDVLVYLRGDTEDEYDIYAVAVNIGKVTASINIQTITTRGIIEASTHPISPREITLDDITLNVGEGLVIRLLT